ncbi:MAG: metalloregulator ArsR/SmtB family transcription factor [Alkalispirochaetaceae bacterium]
MMHMNRILELTELLKILADSTRQRLIAALEGNELSVQELQQVLETGQSSISSHLGKLRSLGVVSSRRDGKFSYYRLIGNESAPSHLLQELLEAARDADWYESDQLRLETVLAERREASLAYFNTLSAQNRRSPGQTWDTVALAFSRMVSGLRIADVGCGNGRLSALLASSGNDVIGVDNAPEQIRLARELYEGREGLDFVQAEAESLPFPDSSLDIVIYSHSLHHIPRPDRALIEAARTLAPGGRIIIIDLAAHREEWLREHFGDLWLGFNPRDLERWLEAGELELLDEVEAGSDSEYPIIRTIVLVAEKRPAESPESIRKGAL